MAWLAATGRTNLEKGGNVRMVCDCGRMTNADMMVDVSGLTHEQMEAWDIGGPFLCDGCRERLFLRGVVSRDEFYEALGAPAATLTKLRKRKP